MVAIDCSPPWPFMQGFCGLSDQLLEPKMSPDLYAGRASFLYGQAPRAQS
jgi:hypothetical protein